MFFRKINNQPQVIEALKKAIEKDRLPHALLFQGPAGCGQREAAAELAKTIFCENKKGLESCDACTHCRQISQNTHPDFSFLEPEEDAHDIKVEGIRKLIERASFKPFSANAKVFVIDQAERLNDIAQNAFLKTLEEPLGRTIFVLISSSPEGLLATIRSRVQTLHFIPVTAPQADGSEDGQLIREVLDYVVQYFSEPIKAPDLSRLSREELSRVLDRLMEYHRELLIFKQGAEEILGGQETSFEKEKVSKQFSEEELEERIEWFAEVKEKINENLNVKLTLSILWDSLASVSSRNN